MELQRYRAQFELRGARIWAISNDDPDRLRRFREAEGIEYRLLLDPGGETIRRYGILNVDDTKRGPIPHPSSLVVDGGGVARFVEIDRDYRERPVAETLLEAIAGLEDEE